MINYYNKELAIKNIRELIDDGLKQMRNPNLTDELCRIWIDYSQKMLELSTNAYNPMITLNYLKVTKTIIPTLKPYEKIGICLDYLIGVLGIL